MHPLPFAARTDDTGVAEIGEVAGYFGLALLEHFDEVADTDLAAVHKVEKAKARAVGESGEEAG